jgi:hypothetical protein
MSDIRILAIDPGASTGLALFQGEELLWSGVAKDGADKHPRQYEHGCYGLERALAGTFRYGSHWDLVLVEDFASYSQAEKHGNLQAPAHVNGVFTGIAIATVRKICEPLYGIFMVPNNWTSGKKKEQRKPRLLMQYKLDAKTNHNQLDAINIGDWASRRIHQWVK